ncbi:uncharacterized protein [Nicotiana sylvestris]|uniref:uncharacterized protein n=1 Tax=Nicotiana sylvestris TaxID=4096 RepID=UPI00388C363F
MCVASENTMLQEMKDANSSLGISSMALRTLFMRIEHDRQKERRMTIFKKMTSKYKEYHTKHRTLADFFSQDGEFQSLRDELKQKDDKLTKKDEELRERDNELMRSISRCSELEAALKAKEDELKGEARAIDLRDELSAKIEELGQAEKGRMADMAEAVALDNALRVCRSEWTNEAELSTLKLARLEERIMGLKKDLSELNEQVVALRAERIQQQVAGKVSEAELEGIRVKARAARKACGYDPGTPGGDDDDDVADGLASDPWYDDEYDGGDDVV